MSAMFNSTEKYSDMIDLPHHVSKTRMQMTLRDRAAQFSPFAALSGYDAAISETARLTEERLELTEDCRRGLDEQLMKIMAQASEKPVVVITYFKPDARKNGGSYEVAEGCIRKLRSYERVIVMEDKTEIPVDDVAAIDMVGR